MGKKYVTSILGFVAIYAVAFYLDNVHAVQLVSDRLSDDFYDLRVSSHQLHGPNINYHSIETQNDRHPPRTLVEQLTNHIGKPLVALSPRSGMPQPRFDPTSTRTAEYQNKTDQWRLMDQNIRTTAKRRIPPSGVCQWMLLQEFKNVSLAAGELIVRDSEGEPRYILTIRGFLRRDDDSYFPLNKFQVHPEASEVVTSSSSVGAGFNLPGNCTTNFKSGNLYLQPIQKPGRLFEEKITLHAECGYLVLQLQGNGIYLVLKSISFYRNLDAVSQTPVSGRKNRPQSRAIPLMLSEHLVFSNEGTQSYPLLVLLLSSRYICQNRIVLTGKNSVQLELTRFELQRITHPMLREFKMRSVEETTDINQAKVITLSGRPTGMRTKRATDGVAQRDPSSLVARCPNPTGPLNPLTFMMDPLFIKRNYDTLSGAYSDRLTQASSSASHWADSTGVNSKGSLTTACYLLTLYFVICLVSNLKNL